MRGALTLICVLILSLTSCEKPESLEAIAGVSGVVTFDSVWPDSIKAAAVVIFDDELDIQRLDETGYKIIDHYVTFSDPIGPGTTSAEYFIQLTPGGYLAMVIGLLVEPAELLTNDEMFQNIQNYIVIPENSIPRGILIRKNLVNEQTGWSVRF